MNHKWKKIKKENKIIENIRLFRIKECVNCSLRKGVMQLGWKFYNTVYFDHNDNILMVGFIPFECNHPSLGDFLKEEDFKILL